MNCKTLWETSVIVTNYYGALQVWVDYSINIIFTFLMFPQNSNTYNMKWIVKLLITFGAAAMVVFLSPPELHVKF